MTFISTGNASNEIGMNFVETIYYKESQRAGKESPITAIRKSKSRVAARPYRHISVPN